MIAPCDTFAARLACLRRWRRMTQRDLSRMIDTYQSVVSCWETGRRSPLLAAAVELAHALDVPLAYLDYTTRCPVCGQWSLCGSDVPEHTS